MPTYFSVDYDNEASGPFVAEAANLTWPSGGIGWIVRVIDNGTTGQLKVALLAGSLPTDGQTLTQVSTTADADGNANLMLYPAYFREDVAVASSGAITWVGPALGATHSFRFDGQTGNVAAADILTFSGGQTAEVITVEEDTGAAGELSVRFISNIDQGLPADNDTFNNGTTGDGTVDGAVHDRTYLSLHLHRLLGDLNDNPDVSGNDDLAMPDPTASARDTDQIVRLLSTMTINDEVSQHMYGGSVSQASGDTLYSGLAVQVTSPNSDTQPVLIQDDGIITDYWKNAYNPDSIIGNIRILVKTREDGVDIDGKRIRGALLEYGDSYFFGGTTLGTAETALALFSTTDGNNATAVATVAGAPYNTIVITEGYQTIDYNNGNGATPYAYEIDYGSASALQTYERSKYIQRRGTAETIFARDAQLFVGINLNWAYDNESTLQFSEDEVLAWGTEITYSAQTTLNFTIGEVIDFSPSGASGRLLYDNDAGATGTLVLADVEGTPDAADTMLGVTSGAVGDVDTVTINTTSGQALLAALDDQGTTGNMYTQQLTGLTPVNNQRIYGETSDATALINGTPATRTVNNQYVGVFTGSNFQTNFGIAIDPTDAIVGDLLRNLLDVQQAPPNNQQGVVDSLEAGDYVTAFPWDGSTLDVNGDPEPDFDEMTLAATLTSGASTQVDVGTAGIPENTPQVGQLRVQRDSDSNVALVDYDSHDGDSIFEIVGTAPFTATAGNTVMRALIDVEHVSGGSENYTAVKGAGSTQVAITVRNGSPPNGPIVTFKTTATFGTTGFSISAIRNSDA